MAEEVVTKIHKTLNPEAAEFFPIYYRTENTRIPPFPANFSSYPHHHLFPPLPPPPLNFPHPNPTSFHYPNLPFPSPSPYCFSNPNIYHPSHHHPPVPQPRLDQNGACHQKGTIKKEEKKGFTRIKSFWRRKLGLQAHVSKQVAAAEGNTKSKNNGTNRNQEGWRADHDTCDINGDEKRQRQQSCRIGDGVGYYCSDQHSKRSYVRYRNKMKHPVLPVEKDGTDTTVMIRNIPNRYTREMLTDFLDHHCMAENEKAKAKNSGVIVNEDEDDEDEDDEDEDDEDEDDEDEDEEEEPVVSAFDFLYLPIDFKNCVNKGYAFVNFTDPRAAWNFYIAAHNHPWGVFQSNKIREVASARLQGKEELVKHFEKIEFPCEDKEEFLPVCFSPPKDGTSDQKVNLRTIGKCIPAVKHRAVPSSS